MIVRKLKDLLGTDHEVDDGNWVSRRLILADDGMGYSVHDTIIRAGTETHIHYKHHLESVYCISGSGEVKTLADDKVWRIEPDTIYALNEHDEHLLRADEGADWRLFCVFRPALTGQEVHDESGVYPAPAESA